MAEKESCQSPDSPRKTGAPLGPRQLSSLSSTSLSPDASPWTDIDHPLTIYERRNAAGGAIPRQQSNSNSCVVQPSAEGPSELVTAGTRGDKKYSSKSPSTLTPTTPSSPDEGTALMAAMINQFSERMPSYLKVGYYDVMILYSEEDREAAMEYKDHLQSEIELEKGHRVQVVLYDDDELVSLAGSKIKSLEYGFQRCTFAFVYLTKSFCECEWCAFSSEECLMEAIYNADKKWCVVPVYTVSRSKADFKIPMGLNSLKGVNYYNNDEFYKRGLRRLIGDKLHVRLRNNEKHFMKRYHWACEESNRLTLQEMTRKRVIENQKRTQQELEQIQKSKIVSSQPDVEIEKESASYGSLQKQDISSSPTSRVPSESTDRSMRRCSLDDTPSLDQGPRSPVNPRNHSGQDLPERTGKTSDILSAGDKHRKSSSPKTGRRGKEDNKIVIHEHHHYYEPSEPTKVINYNITGDNVIVGSGTIVSNTEGKENILTDENTSVKESFSNSAVNKSISNSSSEFSSAKPNTSPVVSSSDVTASVITVDSPGSRSQVGRSGESYPSSCDDRFQTRGVGNTNCTTDHESSQNTSSKQTAKVEPSRNKPKKEESMPLKSGNVAVVRPVATVPPLNDSANQDTSEKSRCNAVAVPPFRPDYNETHVKTQLSQNDETRAKNEDIQDMRERMLDEETGCKVVTPTSYRPVEEDANRPNNRCSASSLEVDSPDTESLKKEDSKVLSMRSSDPDGFVKILYETEAEKSPINEHLSAEELKLKIVIAARSMGYSDEKIRLGLVKLKKRRTAKDLEHLDVNYLIDAMEGQNFSSLWRPSNDEEAVELKVDVEKDPHVSPPSQPASVSARLRPSRSEVFSPTQHAPVSSRSGSSKSLDRENREESSSGFLSTIKRFFKR